MSQSSVSERIGKQLDHIEQQYQVRILYACESGSRAWGFASPDSDYDVRFIYTHKLDWYLSVFPGKDVIEQPISDELDFHGWELRKALSLLHKGNATLIEWLNSPIIYRQNDRFMQDFKQLLAVSYQPEKAFFHYYHMAKTHLQKYLQGESINYKKYLYALRPLLAANYIQSTGKMAPMDFETLVSLTVFDPIVLSSISDLIAHKRQAHEKMMGSKDVVLHDFLVGTIDALAQISLASNEVDVTLLDAFLHQTITQSLKA